MSAADRAALRRRLRELDRERAKLLEALAALGAVVEPRTNQPKGVGPGGKLWRE